MNLFRSRNPLTTVLSTGLALAAACLLSACGGGGGGSDVDPGSLPEYVLNPAFGDAGVVTSTGTNVRTFFHRADVAADGTMVLLGTSSTTISTFEPLLIEKRRADGSLETAFGVMGRVEVAGSPGYTPRGVFLDEQDGSIVALANRGVVGYTLLRRSATGAPVASFGTNGALHVTTANIFKAAGMVVEADGSIVVAGYTDTSGYVMRYLASGAPDPSWNGGAPYTFKLFGSNTYLTSLVRRAGGGYFVGGRRYLGGQTDMLFVGCFGTDGTPVASFGSAGFFLYTPAEEVDLSGLVARPGGGVVVYGAGSSNTAVALGVTASGNLDATFDLRVLTEIPVPDVIRATDRYADGSITIGMRTLGSHDVALWRLLPNGDTDLGFGESGLFVVPVAEVISINQLEPHPGGGFLALGNLVRSPGFEGVVMHLIPGTP